MILARTPAARWGKAGEIAGAAVFLAPAAAGFITGVTLPVDGGYPDFQSSAWMMRRLAFLCDRPPPAPRVSGQFAPKLEFRTMGRRVEFKPACCSWARDVAHARHAHRSYVSGRDLLLTPVFRLEGCLALGHRRLVARWIDPHVRRCTGSRRIQFRQHAEVGSVGTQEDVNRKTFQYRKGMPVVRGDPRV
jgi:hypothetical protein